MTFFGTECVQYRCNVYFCKFLNLSGKQISTDGLVLKSSVEPWLQNILCVTPILKMFIVIPINNSLSVKIL